jgi:hypothetical protein
MCSTRATILSCAAYSVGSEKFIGRIGNDLVSFRTIKADAAALLECVFVNGKNAARSGGSLWVYSQEMVLVSLAMNRDFFDVCSREELLSFGEGHRALEYLMKDMGFDWPSTDIFFSSNSTIDDIQWVEKGGMSRIGYKVGRNGLNRSARERILDEAMSVDFSRRKYGYDWNYREWGNPSSAERLQKIANCIASFARLRKQNITYDNSEAISDYESDLNYLNRTYYRNDLGFRWPNPEVF